MKKILFLSLALLVVCANVEAKDYAKLHMKEMQKSQKYATSKTYFADYAPQASITNNFEIKDPKLIKLGNYKEISDAQYIAKLAKDNIEYAKINNFLLTRKIDNYNTSLNHAVKSKKMFKKCFFAITHNPMLWVKKKKKNSLRFLLHLSYK